VERIGEEIDRRVDARLGNRLPEAAPRRRVRRPRDRSAEPGHLGFAHVVLALGSMGFATGVTAVLTGPNSQDHAGLLVAFVWLAIVVINVAYARRP
jgi:hypothetical protein